MCVCVCSIIYALFADRADILLRLLKSATEQDRERERVRDVYMWCMRVLPHMYIGCCMCGVVLWLPPHPPPFHFFLFFFSLSLTSLLLNGWTSVGSCICLSPFGSFSFNCYQHTTHDNAYVHRENTFRKYKSCFCYIGLILILQTLGLVFILRHRRV